MSNLIQLTLYTTSHCHLCEQALALLTPIDNIELTLAEIAEDEQLLTRYGTRIPVLQRKEKRLELDWPFNQDDIMALIEA